jgi:7,8-dihydroneopterin aldolase/epimerase/oxygenase
MSPPVTPRQHRVYLRDYRVACDIGFHDWEVGSPQALAVTVEAWLDPAYFAAEDRMEAAWNYDLLRQAIERLAAARRWNLQESFARALWAEVAALPGVQALRVATSKPDVYPHCAGVGVELCSFAAGERPV